MSVLYKSKIKSTKGDEINYNFLVDKRKRKINRIEFYLDYNEKNAEEIVIDNFVIPDKFFDEDSPSNYIDIIEIGLEDDFYDTHVIFVYDKKNNKKLPNECLKFNNLKMCDNIKTFYRGLFEDVYVDNINLPSALTSIPDRGFCNSPLKTITIKENVQYIGYSAFESCLSLNEVYISQKAKIKELRKNTFCYCKNLSSITLPNTLEKIGDDAFYNCSSLKDVALPLSIKKIDTGAFCGCRNISNLNLSSNHKELSIGKFAFIGTKIKEINLKSLIYIDVDSAAFDSKVNIIYPFYCT